MVISPSTTLNLYPGYIKREVSKCPLYNFPSLKEDSNARVVVVPTAITFHPSFFNSFILLAVRLGIKYLSLCILCSLMSLTYTLLKVAYDISNVRYSITKPISLSCLIS